MIIDNKQTEVLEARRRVVEEEQQDPPPAYATLAASSVAGDAPANSSSSIHMSQPRLGSLPMPPPNNVIRPSNFVSITRMHDSLKETIAIDPTLYVHPNLLPPLAGEDTPETRKHLRLETMHGSIVAKITIAPCLNIQDRTKVRVLMKSTHGSISARITRQEPRHPFQLTVNSANGNITLSLPRTFNGPIMVSLRHGSVKFSDGVNDHLTTFGEANFVRHCFVGDFSIWSETQKGWSGDEIVIEARHGGVKMQYEDEGPGSVVKTRPSLLNRVFGF